MTFGGIACLTYKVVWPNLRSSIKTSFLATYSKCCVGRCLTTACAVHACLNGDQAGRACPTHCTPSFGSTCSSVVVLHIIMFTVTLVLTAGFLIFMCKPFLTAVEQETRRIAELLSQLPAEVSKRMMYP